MGRFRTVSLFYESRHPKYSAPFTLKYKDHKGRTSMYRKYMEIGDPTEYMQAQVLLGSWAHWKALTSTNWFEPYISEWRRELRTKIESERYFEMEDVAKSQKGSPQAVQATKWLASRYGEQDTKPVRGRPSKEEVNQKLKEETEAKTILNEDAERLGLPV